MIRRFYDAFAQRDAATMGRCYANDVLFSDPVFPRLANGRIVEHTDRFDFWRWARQVLGPVGLVLGWTPSLTKKVQSSAAQSLAAARARRCAGARPRGRASRWRRAGAWA